jgi:tripartite-type tricarboxylate transporter receptor subunit TctC
MPGRTGKLGRYFGCLAAASALLFASAHGWAQPAWPRQPVKLVVGFGAGGGNDLFGRLVAQKLSEKLGQPVVVENKPGAGGRIAFEIVARAPPDGHTLLVAPYGAMIINPAVYKKLPYDPLKSYELVSIVAAFPFVLVVKADSPIKTIKDLVDFSIANPRKANYGTPSVLFQLLGVQFNAKTGAKFEHIPFKSSAEVVGSLLNGQLVMSFIDPGPLVGQLRAGKVRALAMTGSKRYATLPDIPTMAEAGVPGVSLDSFMGIAAPKGTPASVVQRLETELNAMIKVDDVKQRLATMGLVPVGGSPKEFADHVIRETKIWKAVAASAKIELD